MYLVKYTRTIKLYTYAMAMMYKNENMGSRMSLPAGSTDLWLYRLF